MYLNVSMMEMMKFFFASTIVFTLLFWAVPVYAQVDLCPEGNFANLCIPASKSGNIVSNILTILLSLAVILSIIFLVWGGVKWTLAGGDKQAIEEARSTIMAAIVGLVIAFAAFFLFNMVLYFFKVTNGSFTIPKLTQN